MRLRALRLSLLALLAAAPAAAQSARAPLRGAAGGGPSAITRTTPAVGANAATPAARALGMDGIPASPAAAATRAALALPLSEPAAAASKDDFSAPASVRSLETAPLPVAEALREVSVRLADEAASSARADAATGATLPRFWDGSAAPATDLSVAARPVDAVHGNASGLSPPAKGPLPVRPLESLRELRVGSYNFLNLFEKVGDHVREADGSLRRVSDRVAKEEWQLAGQAQAIRDSALDLVVGQEIENIAALEDFNARHLDGDYRFLLIEGNDERGIDVGFLVKKDLPLRIEHRTHKDETWTDPTQRSGPRKLFSRDLPSLIVRAPGRSQPLFVVFGTHFKSKRDRNNDPESNILRKAQADRSAEILARYRREFGEDLPILFAGDFNGDFNKEEAFAGLRAQSGLADAFDVSGQPVPPEDRITHTYHPKGGKRHAGQMDFILVSRSLRRAVRAVSVYRYRDRDGRVKPIPRTYEERSRNPSDHFPVLLTLDFPSVLAAGLAGEAGLRLATR